MTAVGGPGPGLVLQQRWGVPDDQRDAFSEWYVTEHLGDMAAVPGVRRARRFERITDFTFAAPGGADDLVLYDVDDHAAFDTPEYIALSTAPSERTMRVAPRLTRTRTVYRQLFPAAGVLTGQGPTDYPGPAGGTVLLHIMMSCDPAIRDEFEGWYNEEHLPAIVGVDGVVSGRRLVAEEGAPELPGHARPLAFLALYEVRDAGVVEGQAFVQAGSATPRRQGLGDRVSAHVQLYRPVQVAGTS